MDVVLHVGAHRTASTTLQKTLGANGAALADAGVAYWGPKITRAGLFDGLIGRPDEIDPAARRAALRRVAVRARRVERDGARMLIVSEENALGSMRAALSGGGFYSDAGRRVAVLAEAFDAHSLSIALAVRAQDAWWPSVGAFRAARSGACVRRGRVDRMTAQPRDWRDVIRDVSETNGSARVVVWTYEAMACRPDDVFARLSGRTIRFQPLATRKNASNPAHLPQLAETNAERLRRRYRADLAWLRSGADGLAEFMDSGPGRAIPAKADQGRG